MFTCGSMTWWVWRVSLSSPTQILFFIEKTTFLCCNILDLEQ